MRLYRLVLVSALFLAWLGYLGYLVATRPRTPEDTPLVLSRPQILASEVDVIAELPGPPGKFDVPATVVKVLYDDKDQLKEGERIWVSKLEMCHPVPRSLNDQPPPDWSGPGTYLLPLKRLPGQPNHFEVAAIPPSPGFMEPGVCRIYPATAEARAQYDRMPK